MIFIIILRLDIMNIDIDINDENICIICLSKKNLIQYTHTCGIYAIHQECLDKWNSENSENITCVICRKDIMMNLEIVRPSSSCGLVTFILMTIALLAVFIWVSINLYG